MDETELQRPTPKPLTVALAVLGTCSILLFSSIVLAAQINPRFSETAQKMGFNVNPLASITTVVPINNDEPVSNTTPTVAITPNKPNTAASGHYSVQPNAFGSTTSPTSAQQIVGVGAGMRIRSRQDYEPSSIRGVALNGTVVMADGRQSVVDWSGCGGQKGSSWAWVTVPSDSIYRDRSAPGNSIATSGWMDRCGLRDGGTDDGR